MRPPFRRSIRSALGMMLAVGALAMLLVACGQNAEGERSSPSLAGDGTGAEASSGRYADRVFRCGSADFPLSSLSNPASLGDANDAATDALYELIRRPGIVPLPTAGWFEASRTSYRASYLAAVDSDSELFAYVTLEVSAGDWLPSGWGAACRVHPVGTYPGIAWELDPGFGRPQFDDELIHVLADEGCDGKSIGDRLLPPEITYAPDAVTITLLADPLPETEGPQTLACLVSPPTPVTVTLHEPVGERRLIDNSDFPFSDRSTAVPLPTHPRLRAGDPSLDYTAMLVGTFAADEKLGCAWVDTEAGPRTILWPSDFQLAFDPPRLIDRDNRVVVREGELVQLPGGRMLRDGLDQPRCNPSAFLWVAFDAQAHAGLPEPPEPNPRMDPIFYTPFVLMHDGYEVTIDRAIWGLLEHGYVTVSRNGHMVIEGPTDWVLDRGQLTRIVDPFTGEIAIEIPSDTMSAAIDRYMDIVQEQ